MTAPTWDPGPLVAEGPEQLAVWTVALDSGALTIEVVQYRDGHAAARLATGGEGGVILTREQVASLRLACADVLGHLWRLERSERRRAP